MEQTTVEHKFDVNDEVVFPDRDELRKGSVDEVIFYLTGYGEENRVKYRIHVTGRSTTTQVLREEEDLIAR